MYLKKGNVVQQPETALEIQYINSNTFKTDDVVAITGTLQLNQNDVNHFNYILRDCTGKKIGHVGDIMLKYSLKCVKIDNSIGFWQSIR